MQVEAGRVAEAPSLARSIVVQISRAILGKDEVIESAVIALVGRGHLLVEDVPGVGKTTLARAIAKAVGLSFRRVQFTSDMMPADVLGGSVYEPATREFKFHKGPIFTNALLADEINRTSPRTQSALLEAMAEGHVSLDGTTHELPRPFFVVATQNPEDHAGTYALPESQLDRFAMRISVGYPPDGVEREILRRGHGSDVLDRVTPVAGPRELIALQDSVSSVHVEDAVIDYVHEIVLATRKSSLLEVGASTRAAIMLERLVRARALVQGRTFATPDDVKAMAGPVLAHRVRLVGSRAGSVRRIDAAAAIRSVVDEISVPT